MRPPRPTPSALEAAAALAGIRSSGDAKDDRPVSEEDTNKTRRSGGSTQKGRGATPSRAGQAASSDGKPHSRSAPAESAQAGGQSGGGAGGGPAARDPKDMKSMTDEQLMKVDLKELQTLMDEAGYPLDKQEETKSRRRRLQNRHSAKISAMRRQTKYDSIAKVNDKLMQELELQQRRSTALQRERDHARDMANRLAQDNAALRNHIGSLRTMSPYASGSGGSGGGGGSGGSNSTTSGNSSGSPRSSSEGTPERQIDPATAHASMMMRGVSSSSEGTPPPDRHNGESGSTASSSSGGPQPVVAAATKHARGGQFRRHNGADSGGAHAMMPDRPPEENIRQPNGFYGQGHMYN